LRFSVSLRRTLAKLPTMRRLEDPALITACEASHCELDHGDPSRACRAIITALHQAKRRKLNGQISIHTSALTRHARFEVSSWSLAGRGWPATLSGIFRSATTGRWSEPGATITP